MSEEQKAGWGVLDKFKPDQKKRESGVLVEVDPKGDYPEARVVKEAGKLPTFTLANATGENPKWDKAFEKGLRPYRAAQDKGDATKGQLAEMYLEILRETFADVCILDWCNVPVAFSKDAALALTTENPEVYDKLLGVAQDRRNFRVDYQASVEADAKNS